ATRSAHIPPLAMQKPSMPSSLFLNSRVLFGLLLCGATACSILILTRTGLGSLYAQTPANLEQRTLSFEERVSYQRAIEDVYWRHRIWPKENANPKPSLDAVMSQAQIENKVTDYLRKSQALEDHWQRPITAKQLQAEMDRMAEHTRQPEVLQELFDALGNDPVVVAECLARPALANRLLTNWYAYDQRIHGELKQRAEAELQACSSVEQMKQLSGKYGEIEYLKSDSAQAKQDRDSGRSINLNVRDWDQTVQRLAATFNKASGLALTGRDSSLSRPPAVAKGQQTLPTGKLSTLREDESRYYITAVITKTSDHLRLATVSWPKEALSSWLIRVEAQSADGMPGSSDKYKLPMISGGGCVGDIWTFTSGLPDSRDSHTAVWTGTEMIIWGGEDGSFNYVNTGGRYNPSTDSWMVTSTANAPTPRINHTATWTGIEMIIWGGHGNSPFLNSGGRYDPGADNWALINVVGAPEARANHTAVWTGSEMIVWGGRGDFGYLNNGAKYDPNTDNWLPTATADAPSARSLHTVVWSDSEMIVWGGQDESFNDLDTGGRYNPNTDTWVATSTTNAPSARTSHTAVWTGDTMIIWGGLSCLAPFNCEPLDTGRRYDPNTDNWIAVNPLNAPTARSGHTTVWTGNEMIVWGGLDSIGFANTGATYDPNADGWTATSTISSPDGRSLHSAVWTGTEMIIWGGYNGAEDLDTGGRYSPTTNSWVITGLNNVPSSRELHTAVWTGNEMIVWGGFDPPFTVFNTGARYRAATDSWNVTSTIDAPTPRAQHRAVWTGIEMIVWGGQGPPLFNTGGRYNPGTDNWIATSTINAPTGREEHTAVWTGSEMIVWGGYDGDVVNSGARYDADADSWTATTTTAAPTARADHTAIWTGKEMVVWGGFSGGTLNTGSRYNPGTDS